ncbi:hypothetical protein ACXWRS_11820, partial [Streptococcus pyogenes]
TGYPLYPASSSFPPSLSPSLARLSFPFLFRSPSSPLFLFPSPLPFSPFPPSSLSSSPSLLSFPFSPSLPPSPPSSPPSL